MNHLLAELEVMQDQAFFKITPAEMVLIGAGVILTIGLFLTLLYVFTRKEDSGNQE